MKSHASKTCSACVIEFTNKAGLEKHLYDEHGYPDPRLGRKKKTREEFANARKAWMETAGDIADAFRTGPEVTQNPQRVQNSGKDGGGRKKKQSDQFHAIEY
jgi:hypothetical protein